MIVVTVITGRIRIHALRTVPWGALSAANRRTLYAI